MRTKKVSVIIPTRNRKPVLFKTLRKLQELNDSGMEVLVYDDASDEDYRQELKGIFPDVNFYKSDQRVGPCELRNRLVKKARSEFIIGLDDDSYFVNKKAYEKSLKVIKEFPEVGLAAFKVVTEDGVHFPRNRKKERYFSYEFMSCAFIAKKKALSETQGFDPLIMRAGEERDIAMNIMDAGWKILQSNDIEVFHESSPYDRDHQFIHGYAFRNELFFYLKYFPFFYALIFMVKCLISHSIFCFRKRWFRAYFFGVRNFVKNFLKFLKKRKPIKRRTFYRYLQLLKERPGN